MGEINVFSIIKCQKTKIRKKGLQFDENAL